MELNRDRTVSVAPGEVSESPVCFPRKVGAVGSLLLYIHALRAPYGVY